MCIILEKSKLLQLRQKGWDFRLIISCVEGRQWLGLDNYQIIRPRHMWFYGLK